MKAAKIISAYNRLDGKQVSKETLIKLYRSCFPLRGVPVIEGIANKLLKIILVLNNGEKVHLKVDAVTMPVAKKKKNKAKPVVKRQRSAVIPSAPKRKGKKVIESNLVEDNDQKESAKVDTKPKRLPQGILKAEAIKSMKFREITIPEEFKKDFVRLYNDTQIMTWGLPGSGKTVKLLKLAQAFAEGGLKVLYIANEEMKRSTLTMKLNEFNIGHKNLDFSETVPSSISHWDVVFFDSVQTIGFTLDKYKAFVKTNPGKIFVLVIQSTKEGDFRGGKDWEHEVDIAGEIRNRKWIFRKNRLDSDFDKKRDKLYLEDEISSAKKKLQIKEAVKKSKQKQQLLNLK